MRSFDKLARYTRARMNGQTDNDGIIKTIAG